MFLVSLNIASKLKANMFVVFEMSAGEKVVGRKGVRHAISMWERIEPKYSVIDQTYDHETWDSLKSEGVIPTASSIFDSTDVSFDLRDVLVLSAQIKADVPIMSCSGANSGLAFTMVTLKPCQPYIFLTLSRHATTVVIRWFNRFSTVPKCRPRDTVVKKGISFTNIVDSTFNLYDGCTRC